MVQHTVIQQHPPQSCHTQNERDIEPKRAVKQQGTQSKNQLYLQCEVERLEKAFMIFQLDKVGYFHRITVEK